MPAIRCEDTAQVKTQGFIAEDTHTHTHAHAHAHAHAHTHAHHPLA